jgi:acyl transferase domain-containing protein
MSILNALGKSPEEVWAASLAMKSGITLVPPSRWDHALFYDPRPRSRTRPTARWAPSWTFMSPAMNSGFPPMISGP